jgi:hypothetical protein
MTLRRRGFLTGLAAAFAAPAVIKTAGLLMPVKTPPGLYAMLQQTTREAVIPRIYLDMYRQDTAFQRLLSEFRV